MVKKYKNISVISTGSWVPESLDNKTVDQKYNVIIKNLIIDASIGIHEHEKVKKQRVSISLSIEVVDNISLVDHKIENFLSYENVINNIKFIINKGHIDLVETLSYEILSNIFSDSRASKVWLKIEKLDVFAEAQSVGLEIIKTRKKFY